MLRKLFFTLVFAGGIVFAIAMLARFSNGPVGPFPGGPFKGSLTNGAEPPWSTLLANEDSVELQVNPSDPRSVRVWFVLHNGAIHIPSAWAPHKEWPEQVEADPRVVLRARGRLYDRKASRVKDPRMIETLLGLVSQKYGAGRGDPETTWFFRLDPPGP
jgi:hypothetical protein